MARCYELRGPRFEIGIDDGAYPFMLRESPNPPKTLYGIGDPDALLPGVAVIGARKATPYGIEATRRFATHAARRGLTIISGGARGCDQVAHRAALDMEVPTVVVFGSAPDVPYPKSGLSLFQEVVDKGGAVISENSWGMPPMRALFPRRNRIIAGLSMLLIIAEAGLPSGTFSTADAALAAGRDVAVVPGSICSPYSHGTNKLMFQGASPIVDEETLDDVLEEAFASLPMSMFPKEGYGDLMVQWREQLDDDPLLRALAAEAYTPSELTAYFDFSAAELLMRLSQYELSGLVEKGRDGRYQAVCTMPSAPCSSRDASHGDGPPKP